MQMHWLSLRPENLHALKVNIAAGKPAIPVTGVHQSPGSMPVDLELLNFLSAVKLTSDSFLMPGDLKAPEIG